jgi:hypothetical protein
MPPLGPRSTSAFLVLTALLFAVLLGLVSWRTSAAAGAVWLLAAGLVVAAAAIILAILFARGVGEGRS